MERQGAPGVKFDVEGSGYGFRVVKTIAAGQAEMPHHLQDGAARLILAHASCAKPSRTSKNPRSAKSPTPASAAATCWRSGSAKATRSRPNSSARPRSSRCSDGETFYAHNLGLPELREAVARYTSGLHPAGRGRAHRDHLGGRQRADAGGAGAGRCRRRGGGGHAGVAQPHGAAARSWAPGVQARAAASRGRAPGRSTCDALLARGHAGHPAADRQCAEQPDRLDAHPRRAAGDPRPLPPDRHLDPGRRGLRAALLRADAPMAARPASSTSPTPTTGSWSCTASRKSFLMTGWRLGWLVVPPATDARTWAS